MQVREPGRRLAGAAASAAVAGLVACSAWWLGFATLSAIAAWGIPIGLVVGWWIGPRAATVGRAIGSIVRASAAAIALAVLGVCLLGLAQQAAFSDAGASALVALVYLPFVVAYASLFGLPVAVPVAAGATAIVRLVAVRPRLGWGVLAGVATVAIALGAAAAWLAPTIEARVGSDLHRSGEAPIALVLGRTTVTWEVRNCADWPYSLTALDVPLVGQPRTATARAGQRATSRGSTEVEPGWRLMLTADPGASLARAYRGPVEVVNDIPAGVVDVRVEVGPRGDWSSEVWVDGVQASTLAPQCSLPG